MDVADSEEYDDWVPSNPTFLDSDHVETVREETASFIETDMADPFEVRVRFTLMLQHLNASVNSAQKAAQYALKYKDMDEDLHSCILEQLESVRPPRRPRTTNMLTFLQNNLNTRANIMYFLEHFLDAAQKDGARDYIRMMQRDIIRVVDAVAPDDGSGATNVGVVRKVGFIPLYFGFIHSINIHGPC